MSDPSTAVPGVVHSFPPISSAHAATLILGSMPGKVSLAAGEYYAHPRNHFWRFMSSILGVPADAPYATRCRTLAGTGFALWDVLQACTRSSSLDSDIVEASIVPNDFERFLRGHSRITTIFFNGARAEKIYARHVQPRLPRDLATIEAVRLPSTSPANASVPLQVKLDRWRAVLRAHAMALHASVPDVADALGRALSDGRLRRLPRHPERRDIILAIVSLRMERRYAYTEVELNAVLQQALAAMRAEVDHVTCRRYLVDLGFVKRDRAGSRYFLNYPRVESTLTGDAAAAVDRLVAEALGSQPVSDATCAPANSHRSFLLECTPASFRPQRPGTSTMRIGRAGQRDADRCGRLWSEVGAGFWTERKRWRRDRWLEQLRDPRVSFWIASVAGEEAGCFELTAMVRGVKMQGFGLLPAFRGKGLGRALLTAATERAFATGAGKVWLHTATDDHRNALPNYLSGGYRIVGERALRNPMPSQDHRQ